MERFISEAITVDVDSMHSTVLASGAPGCPLRFCWREQWYDVAEVVEAWKHTSNEGGRAKGETYVRSHCFRVRTLQGIEAVIYCDRQLGRHKKGGWWIYTIKEL